ncbi:MAG TPA: formate dehydrogenase accessory sulfurtransferase FdhD [Syntrophomonadaceae bacterium]|nr:formate dehydrogenase accessory sulfurtransferase FdhD [Syntrophomonadaceae bacterium]
MKIINDMPVRSCYTTFPATVYMRNGTKKVVEKQVLIENCLDVFIGSQKAIKFVCTPEHLGELVLGYFYSEGLIQTVDDIELIHISADGHCADITFNQSCNPHTVWPQVDRVLSSTGSKRFWPGKVKNAPEIKPLPEHSWREEDIYLMAQEFFDRKALIYSQTRAAHSCFMKMGSRTLYSCEDIGRHNTLDKIIGLALRDGIDINRTAIYSSGRIPIDMAIKVIRSRIPVLVSKTMPSEQAVKLARRYNLTLICSACPDSMTVFNK